MCDVMLLNFQAAGKQTKSLTTTFNLVAPSITEDDDHVFVLFYQCLWNFSSFVRSKLMQDGEKDPLSYKMG